MLSSAEHHKMVPRNLKDNIRWRLYVLEECRKDPAMRVAVHKACEEDFIFWVTTFVIQFNPNAIGEGSTQVGPFITWEFQEDAARKILSAVEERDDLLIEKSREMGASWLCILVFLWLAMFKDWQKFLFISRNEAAVNSPDDPDSLFWKIDHVLSLIPVYIKGDIERKVKGGGSYTFKRTKSIINGQATTKKAGVGGRATAMFIDEFSQIDEAHEVLHRTAHTSSSRIFNGTHVGLGTAFYELSQRPDMNKLQMHWTQHPDKKRGLYYYDRNQKHIVAVDKKYEFPPGFEFVYDGSPNGGPFPGIRSPWYDAKCKAVNSARAIAMDLDIDPKGSTSQFFDAYTIGVLKREYARRPLWEGDINYDRDTGEPTGFVEKSGGPLKLWINTVGGLPPVDTYVGGADVSAGQGATPSCLSVARASGEKVLEYANPFIEPQDFAYVMVAIARMFKDESGEGAWIAWECPGPGETASNRIMDIGYMNIYWRRNEMSMSRKETDTPGWYSTQKNKRLLLDDYRAALQSRQYMNYSEAALEETLAFAYSKDGKGIEHSQSTQTVDPTAARENHGDRVIADALCWMMLKEKRVPDRPQEDRQDENNPHTLAYRRQLRIRERDADLAWVS